jgi:hypothetical protein
MFVEFYGFWFSFTEILAWHLPTLKCHSDFPHAYQSLQWRHFVGACCEELLRSEILKSEYSHVTKECASTNPEWQILKYTLTSSYSSVWQPRTQELWGRLSHCVVVTSLSWCWSYMVQSTFFLASGCFLFIEVCVHRVLLICDSRKHFFIWINSSIVFWIGRIKSVIPCVLCSYSYMGFSWSDGQFRVLKRFIPTLHLGGVGGHHLLTHSIEQSPSWKANWFCS